MRERGRGRDGEEGREGARREGGGGTGGGDPGGTPAPSQGSPSLTSSSPHYSVGTIYCSPVLKNLLRGVSDSLLIVVERKEK